MPGMERRDRGSGQRETETAGAGPRTGTVRGSLGIVPQRIVHFAALAALALDAASAWCQPTARWYRGNTHTHTLNSDGNATPDDVARWYRMKGYEFVVITDHEFLTDVVPLNGTIGAPGKFLVIRGQEVTQRLADPTVQPSGRRQAHINAIGINRVVMPVGSSDGATVARDATMADLYARNIAGIRAAGGIAQVNHPNWLW